MFFGRKHIRSFSALPVDMTGNVAAERETDKEVTLDNDREDNFRLFGDNKG